MQLRETTNGAPAGTRTQDPLLRRQMLYPTELRAHVIVNKQLPLIQKRWLTPNYILSYYTSRMVAQNGQAEDGDQEKTWQPTHCANIVRHIPSEIYYARLRIKGKLIWRSCRRGAQLTVSGEDARIWGGESIGLPFAVELEKLPRKMRLGRGGPN